MENQKICDLFYGDIHFIEVVQSWTHNIFKVNLSAKFHRRPEKEQMSHRLSFRLTFFQKFIIVYYPDQIATWYKALCHLTYLWYNKKQVWWLSETGRCPNEIKESPVKDTGVPENLIYNEVTSQINAERRGYLINHSETNGILFEKRKLILPIK